MFACRHGRLQALQFRNFIGCYPRIEWSLLPLVFNTPPDWVASVTISLSGHPLGGCASLLHAHTWLGSDLSLHGKPWVPGSIPRSLVFLEPARWPAGVLPLVSFDVGGAWWLFACRHGRLQALQFRNFIGCYPRIEWSLLPLVFHTPPDWVASVTISLSNTNQSRLTSSTAKSTGKSKPFWLTRSDTDTCPS